MRYSHRRFNSLSQIDDAASQSIKPDGEGLLGVKDALIGLLAGLLVCEFINTCCQLRHEKEEDSILNTEHKTDSELIEIDHRVSEEILREAERVVRSINESQLPTIEASNVRNLFDEEEIRQYIQENFR
jgi:hypothetical protein